MQHEKVSKLDLKIAHLDLYKPSAKGVKFIHVPAFQYLMIDGEGNPNTSPRFKEAVETLYGISYALKFMAKTSQDYVVMPLEGLWWTDDMRTFSVDHKEDWQWTLMILQPVFITQVEVDKAIKDVTKKKGNMLCHEVRFETWEEGFCGQIMHIGPYAAEAATIEKLHLAISQQGYQRSGKHHEIYLSDPRKAKPEAMKTILRQPVEIKAHSIL